jgi:hypothetical protein
MQPPSRETGAAVLFIGLHFVTKGASYQSQMRVLTDEENAAFNKWKSECEKTEIKDGDGEIAAVSYAHPSTRISLNIPHDGIVSMSYDSVIQSNPDGSIMIADIED